MGVLLVFALLSLSWGMFHDLKIVKDTRRSFLIESFGFGKGGKQNITYSALITEKGSNPNVKNFCFLVKVTPSDNSQFMDESLKLSCSSQEKNDIVIPVVFEGHTDVMKIKDKPTGFFNLYFVNEARVPVSFDLKVTQRSIGKNYLSIGLLPLPVFYLIAALIYLTLAGIWIFGVLRDAPKVFTIHHLMTAMVLIKMLSVLLLSIDYHFKNLVGHPGGWTIAYYTINFVKGISLFFIVALIGSGWQFIKPFLSDKDKQIFMIVVPLQVLDNIALVIIDETLPGVRGWSSWKNLFRLVDVICCATIVFPIIWSLKHLRDASSASGKSALNVHKLQMFRNFYIIVIAYIYFTRIVVYMLLAVLPYGSVWLSDLSIETATIALFVTVAYKFMPEDHNQLLKVIDSDEEIEVNDFGEPVIDLQKVVDKKEAEAQQERLEVQVKEEVKSEHKKEATFQSEL